MANRFAKKFGQDAVAVIEPSNEHYYQPMWTLVGAGLKTFDQTQRQTKQILPKQCKWIQDRVQTFSPEENFITTENGDELHYEILVVAMGLQLDYHLIKGLPEAFETDPNVVSNYSPKYVHKTFPAIKTLEGGDQAIFTFPNKPIKCAGAPQKILYLTDDHLRRAGKRDGVKLVYNTALPVIFGVPKYAEALLKVVKERDLHVNFQHNLIEVKPDSKEAVFELLDKPGETATFKYSMLHVAPPCSAPDVVKSSSLVDASGFVEVDKHTLQHTRYPNVFSLGDCSNIPTAKTAAGVSTQSVHVAKSITAYLGNKTTTANYDGYTSCPLLTKKGACILAEFGFDGKVLETFPINQAKERWTMYHLKADLMPQLYWHGLVKGIWGGPTIWRKLLHLGFGP